MACSPRLQPLSRRAPAILLALLAASCATAKPAKEVQPMPALREFVVERSSSPWRGYTSSYDEEQRGYTVAAASVAGLERIPHLAAYELDGEPYMAIDRPGRRVVLNERLFGTFVRPDAPRLASGERVELGVVRDRRLLADPLSLVSFLVESELIRTYWHIEARLRLVELTETPAGFGAALEGSHVYYTNRKNEDAYSFRIEVETATGSVFVQGGP